MADSSASKPRPSRTVKEGWSMKQGPPPWKTWKKRYLALNDTGLFYFKSAKKTKADLKGSIALASIALIQPLTESKRKFCMKIETAGHNFLFAFEDEKDLKGWVDAIEKEKDKNKQGTLKKMKKRESQPRLEDLFTPPQPTSAPPSTTASTTPSHASVVATSSPQMSKGSRRAAAKERRKLEKEKEKEEKGREKEKKEKKKNDKKLGKTPSSVKKMIEEKGPAPIPPSADTKYIRTSKGEKLPKQHHSKGGGKKESKSSESEEDPSDFRTMLVHPNQHDTGEFREYLPEPESELPEPRGSFPTHEELSQLSQSKLKEADHAIDIERDAQIRAIKAKYAAKKVEIIDILINKEVAAIKQKYADRRKRILEELKNRGVEAS